MFNVWRLAWGKRVVLRPDPELEMSMANVSSERASTVLESTHPTISGTLSGRVPGRMVPGVEPEAES